MKQLIILIIVAVGVCLFVNPQEYIEIPSSSIRMRVIAASDSSTDQAEKREVKSFLEEKLYDMIGTARDAEEVEKIINEKKSEIDESVMEAMSRSGIESAYTSNFGYNFFPEKEFKGISYKAGNYKSFVVTLGDGAGENWWCVLYPPLCLVDETRDDYEYHSLIKDTISKYN